MDGDDCMRADNLGDRAGKGMKKKRKLIHLLHELCMLCLVVLPLKRVRSESRRRGNLSSGSESIQPHERHETRVRDGGRRDQSVIAGG